MKRDLILREMDKMIIENNQKISFRNIAANLDIAPSTISYQFQNQDTLYKEYLKYKFKDAIDLQSLESFESLSLTLTHKLYEMFNLLSGELTMNIVEALLDSLMIDYLSILEQLYEMQYKEQNRDNILAITSHVVFAMAFSKNYSKILDNDLSIKENREKFVRNVIAREAR